MPLSHQGRKPKKASTPGSTTKKKKKKSTSKLSPYGRATSPSKGRIVNNVPEEYKPRLVHQYAPESSPYREGRMVSSTPSRGGDTHTAKHVSFGPPSYSDAMPQASPTPGRYQPQVSNDLSRYDLHNVSYTSGTSPTSTTTSTVHQYQVTPAVAMSMSQPARTSPPLNGPGQSYSADVSPGGSTAWSLPDQMASIDLGVDVRDGRVIEQTTFLQEQLNRAKERTLRDRRRISTLEGDLAKAQGEVSRMERERQLMQRQVESLDHSEAETHRQVAVYRSELAQANDDRTNAQRELLDREKDLLDSQSEVRTLRARVTQLESSAEEQETLWQDRVHAVEAQLRERNREMNTLRVSTQDQLADLQTQLRKYSMQESQDLSAAQDHIRSLERQLRHTAAVEAAKHEQYQSHLRSLQRQLLTQTSGGNSTHDATGLDADTLAQTVADDEQDGRLNEAAAETIRLLDAELRQHLATGNAELQAAKEQIAQLQTEVADQDALRLQLTKARDEVSHLQQAQIDLDSAERECQDLRRRLHMLQEASEQREATSAQSLLEAEQVHREQAMKIRQLETLQGQFSNAHELSGAGMRGGETGDSLQDSSVALQLYHTVQKQLHTTEEKLKTAQAEAQVAKEAQRVVEERMRETATDLVSARREIAALQEERFKKAVARSPTSPRRRGTGNLDTDKMVALLRELIAKSQDVHKNGVEHRAPKFSVAGGHPTSSSGPVTEARVVSANREIDSIVSSAQAKARASDLPPRVKGPPLQLLVENAEMRKRLNDMMLALHRSSAENLTKALGRNNNPVHFSRRSPSPTKKKKASSPLTPSATASAPHTSQPYHSPYDTHGRRENPNVSQVSNGDDSGTGGGFFSALGDFFSSSPANDKSHYSNGNDSVLQI